MTIGARIKQARKDREMSRQDLVRATGIPYPTLAGIENGDQASTTRLHAIATALRVRVEWLETGKGPMDAVQPLSTDVSHALRFDIDMIADTAWALREAFESVGKTFRLEEETERFLQMYEARLAFTDLSVPDNMAKLLLKAASLTTPQGAKVEERGGEVPAPGTDKKNVARRTRRKG